MTSVVSVGDLTTEGARAKRAAWMRHYDVGRPPAPHPLPVIVATPVSLDRTGEELEPAPQVAHQAIGLAGPAAANGWFIEIFHSRGTVLHATGKPGRLVDVTAVRAYRFPVQHAAATWYRPVTRKGPSKDWEAGDGWLWRDGLPRSVGVGAVKDVLLGASIEQATAPKPPTAKGACQVCAALVGINKDGTLRVHGPKDDRCSGSRRPPLAVETERVESGTDTIQ